MQTADARTLPFELAVARNIAPGSTAGLPGLVLPAGLTASGLPVALEFDGPAGHDRQLLTLGLGARTGAGIDSGAEGYLTGYEAARVSGRRPLTRRS